MTKEGSNVTMCESGEEQKSGQGDPSRLDSRTQISIQLKLSTLNYHQSHAEHSVTKDDKMDYRDDVKDEGEDENVENEEENEDVKDEEEEKKLHTTPNLSVRASARLR